MGRYVATKKENGDYEWKRVSETYIDPYGEFNGPVWFPKAGGYFDKALRRYFHSKSDKIKFMRKHKLIMEGSSKEYKSVEARGVGKTRYFY